MEFYDNMQLPELRIYIGWDSREPEAFAVAEFSLKQRTSIPLVVHPLKQDELREGSLYWREIDPLAATEFTYTRFLVPALTGFEGFALFCDCDFLWLGDVAELLQHATGDRAVWCVKHDHRPTETVKMDGTPQTVYPRKNWSSLMLLNCAHASTRRLVPEVVNSASGAYLHRMQWADDAEVGGLPVEWNWLEGWNERPSSGAPKAIHFTRGGPWFKNWQHVEFGDLWLKEFEKLKGSGQ
jgi:hypothetical protein